MNSCTEMLDLVAEPLTAAAFSPYGTVIEHTGAARRLYLDAAFEHSAPAQRPRLWISRVEAVAAEPVVLTEMEYHPYSAQTFVPLGDARFLVAVARNHNGEAPAPETIKAFVTRPGQGVTYFPNVWHASLSVLVPGDFLVAMSLTPSGDDDVFLPLSGTVRIRARSPLSTEGVQS